MGVVEDTEKTVSFLTHHLILTAVLVIALFTGIFGVQHLIDQHDAVERQRAHEDLAAVVQQVKVLQDKQAADDAATAQREAVRDAIIKDLIAQASARDKALEEQIKKNATLTAQQAAARMVQEYNAPPTAAQAQGDSVLVDLPLSRQIVSTFDSFQTCKADLNGAQQQIEQQKGSIADLKTQVSDRDKTITGKDTELAKQKKADDDDKKIAVNNEKKKHKWYAIAGMAIVEGIRIYFTGKP